MILRKAVEACLNDACLENCSQCTNIEDYEDCFDFLSTYIHPEQCSFCTETIYYWNDNELKRISTNYCPICGRSLRV